MDTTQPELAMNTALVIGGYMLEVNTARLAAADSDALALVRLRDLVSHFQRRLREIAEETEAALLERIDAEGDIVLSEDERLYVGTTKVTRCIDDQGVLMAILEAGNGNLELLTTGAGGLLASQPWKHGAVRKLIGDVRSNALFVEEVRRDVKTGKPLRSVKLHDKRYAGKGD